jgi:hypothetical protein
MPRIWNGKNLDLETPELGLRLDFASLVPEFVSQVLSSGLCADTEHLIFTPLDDLKAWLRTQTPGEAGLKYEVRELLLAQEAKDRAQATAEGRRFDLVEYELGLMQEDETYEQFNARWARDIFSLMIEESDALQTWSKAEIGSNFSLSMSFNLPDPRKHAILLEDEIETSLRLFGANDKLVGRTLKGLGKQPEYTGMLLLELADRGKATPPKSIQGTAFVSVGLNDCRVGDFSDASLSLGYPRELEGYFLLTFDTLRKQLTLKDEI